LASTHYSTQIEGNPLTQEQIKLVLRDKKHFLSMGQFEKEVKGYYAALDMMEKLVIKKAVVTHNVVQTLHSAIMFSGKINVKPKNYRDGQNIIKDSATGRIVYIPPEAKDVFSLMESLILWIKKNDTIPAPIVAGIAHYQFATIHPYFDGNGRTARLLATMILHLRGYDLKGIYSLEEYYANDLKSYYNALSIGPSHNYYMGRAQEDITSFLEYFCRGMAKSFEKVQSNASELAKSKQFDQFYILRKLDTKQRKAIELFARSEVITSKQIGELFGFKPRTASELCKKWRDNGFIVAADESKKGRKYRLSKEFNALIKEL
jgi:Fic family protein